MERPSDILIEKRQSLLALGWSEKTVATFFSNTSQEQTEAELLGRIEEAKIFASPTFIRMWRYELKQGIESKRAEELLYLAMSCVDLPDDLVGTVEEAQLLLTKIWEIAPHDLFWRDFSRVVKAAYPGERFTEQGGNVSLKRQIHQFRYVISAQQAQWVRDKYRKQGMSDAEALAAYLSGQPRFFSLLRWWLGLRPAYQVKTSARLHNKRTLGDRGVGALPDLVLRYNIKVLQGFHTEFILSSQGEFLNELEVENPSLSGVVNGASFNYGGAIPKDHFALDVRTVTPYDPVFRSRLVKNNGRPFRNPNKRAYRNKRDQVFADDNRALIKYIRQAQRDFIRLLKNYRKI